MNKLIQITIALLITAAGSIILYHSFSSSKKTEEELPKKQNLDNPEQEQEIPKVIDTTKEEKIINSENIEIIEEEQIFGIEGSIGRRYKDFLMSSTKKEDWNTKVEIWKTNKAQGKTFKDDHRPFKLGKNKEPNWTELRSKCINSYKYKNWKDATNKGQLNQEQYWNIVWIYCGKPLQQVPINWGK